MAAEQFPWLPVRWLIRDRSERTERLATFFKPGVAHSVVVPGANHNDIGAHPLYECALVQALR